MRHKLLYVAALSVALAPSVAFAQPDDEDETSEESEPGSENTESSESTAPSESAVSDTDRAAARELATQGSDFYRSGDYQSALDRFDRAYQIIKVPSLAIWGARSMVKLGRLVEASERYLRVAKAPLPADAPDSHRRAVQDAVSERSELMPRIPMVRVVLDGASAGEVTVTIDDRELPSALIGVEQLVDPGQRVVRATRGAQVVEETVNLVERQKQDVTLVFTAPELQSGVAGAGGDSGAAQGGNNTLAYVALAAGGVGLVIGGVTGVMLLGKQSSLEEDCPNRQCEPAHHDDANGFNGLRTVSTIGFVAGGVLTAAGVVLLMSSPSEPERAQVGVFLSGTGGGVRGTF
jgi:hypothetical protein